LQLPTSRALWLTVGCVAVALGAIGVVLPLLPTTPFLIVAAWCFARSSRRLHRWLLANRHFGPLIRNWQENGAIDRRSKTLAVGTMAVSPAFSWGIGVPDWAIGAQVVVLVACAAYILSRPDGPSEAASDSNA
jgi:uncharacterized membrane protein YbaN (DUF454 family)